MLTVLPAIGKEQTMIQIIYDNSSIYNNLACGWGFSALIKHKGLNILFDTGGDAAALKNNLNKLCIKPEDINIIFISHEHWDHINGLPVVLRPKQKVILLKSFPDKIKTLICKSKASMIEVGQFTEIAPDIFSSGEMGKAIKEQALIISTEKGLIIITGCSHPGIVEIVRTAKEELNREVALLLGGFHLKDSSVKEITPQTKALKSLGIKEIAPCHCTGDKAMQIIKEEFKENYITIGTGSKIIF